MLPHQVVAVTVRLFAISLGLSALSALPIVTLTKETRPPGYSYSLFMIVLTAVLALLLWIFPRSVAGKLLPESATPAAETTSADTWLAIGCAIIGLWVLSRSLPGLVRDAYVLLVTDTYTTDTMETKSWVLYNFVQVVLALWLAFGSAGFRKLFWVARNGGIRKAPDTPA
jgi:hypothetical protein